MLTPELSRQLLERTQVPPAEWEIFSRAFQRVDCQKGDQLLAPGDKAQFIYLVTEGVLRNYFLDEKGKEFTKTFRGPGGLIGPYAEILAQLPSRYFIQATTKATVWRFPYEAFALQMRSGDRSWERLGREIAERNYLEKEKREWEFMHLPAQERYENFLRDFGGLVEQIPQYQVASYLGVSPEALNRLLATNRKS